MSACAWMATQALRTANLPCGAGQAVQPARLENSRHDAVERCAQWVASTGRRLTWVEVVEHLGCHRYYAMRLLRVGAERGLLLRTASPNPLRPDLFEGVR